MKEEYKGNEAKDFAGKMEVIGKCSEKWQVYYYDLASNSYWLLDYPNSELQGGGCPRLRKLKNKPSYLKLEDG